MDTKPKVGKNHSALLGMSISGSPCKENTNCQQIKKSFIYYQDVHIQNEKSL
jgi:hypothetical protein